MFVGKILFLWYQWTTEEVVMSFHLEWIDVLNIRWNQNRKALLLIRKSKKFNWDPKNQICKILIPRVGENLRDLIEI